MVHGPPGRAKYDVKWDFGLENLVHSAHEIETALTLSPEGKHRSRSAPFFAVFPILRLELPHMEYT
jgi:hypothetical protein